MKAIVLAATHKRILNDIGREVPLPLVDITSEPYQAKPYLTILLERLDASREIDYITVVTNDAIWPELDCWSKSLMGVKVPHRVISDGTLRPEDRRGPVGDILFALTESKIDDDLLIVGGDNWFTYDLDFFIKKARKRSPAVVVTHVATRHVDPSRFGWVKLDTNSRVIEFRERPTSPVPDSFMKASCVYYASQSDLRWFREFATGHPTVCSPGTFFAWLADRVPVYGIESPASWYDIGRSGNSRLSGPDFIRFRDAVRH